MKHLATLLQDAERLHAASMDEDTTEELQDRAYEAYWDRLREIARVLQTVTGGAIDAQTALRMAIHKQDEIASLVKRLNPSAR